MKSKNITIIVSLFAVLCLGVLLGYVYKSKHTNITLRPIIMVSDINDLDKMKTLTKSEVKYFLSESIEELVNKEYNRTIDYLNFTIVLFAVFLTIILVVFGFFTFHKMKEAENLLDEILKTPNKVMEMYYKDRVNDLLPDLMSEKKGVKSNAIRELYLNNELDNKKHFDLFSSLIYKEYESVPNFYTENNIINIFDILCRLDYTKSILLGYDIFDKFFKPNDDKYVNILIPLLLESTEVIHKERLLNYLVGSDSQKRLKILRSIQNFQIFNNEDIKYIIKNSSSTVSIDFIKRLIQKRKNEFKILEFFGFFNRDIYEYNNFKEFLTVLNTNNELSEEFLLENFPKVNWKSTSDKLGTYHTILNFVKVIDDNDLLKKIILIMDDKFSDFNIDSALKIAQPKQTLLYQFEKDDDDKNRIFNVLKNIEEESKKNKN